MKRYTFILIMLMTLSLSAGIERIDKIVIWGHKLHSHTHSYIHHAFYRAFEAMGYPTFWFDNNDSIEEYDFANTLFLTEGQVDANIPIRDDCLYIIHNCTNSKYLPLLNAGKCIQLQVYTDQVLAYQTEEIAKCIHYDVPGKTVYMPWATDLLPDEIDAIKQRMPMNQNSNKIYWIGTVGDGYFGNINEINPFKQASQDAGYEFIAQGGNVSPEDHQRLIGSSYMAPTIVGKWQFNVNYIPCRIFKNISYGQMGITNSYRVYDLFEKKIVYNPDTYQLFFDAQEALKNVTQSQIFELMDFVRDNHTYINRIETLFDFFERVAGN